jgi:MOSC domain-containing protein YiiM
VSGVVESIHVTPAARDEPLAVERATAVAGRGLEGDRYHDGTGSFSHWKGDRDLTLIEAEAVEAAGLDPGDARRNVVVRGVDLNALVGERFRVGAVECEGRELADPCKHLERLTKPGVIRGLAGRGGLRAAIVSGGEIAVGDAVEPAGPAP